MNETYLRISSATEDKKEKLLEFVVEAVGEWGSLFEIDYKVRIQLFIDDIEEEKEKLKFKRQRLGKVIFTYFIF